MTDITTQQLARHIGQRYKASIKLARFFGKKVEEAKGKPNLESHYLDVALDHANRAAQWQNVARDFRDGKLTADMGMS